MFHMLELADKNYKVVYQLPISEQHIILKLSGLKQQVITLTVSVHQEFGSSLARKF